MKNAICNCALLLAVVLSSVASETTLAESGNDSNSSKAAPLEGRIEQTADFKVPLPAGLTKLKALVPKMDTTHRPVLKGGVTELGSEVVESSFSSDMLGFWGGELKITSIYHARPFADGQQREGITGLVVFHFVKDGNDIKLKPATIFMPHVRKRVRDSVFRPARLEQMKETANQTGKDIDPDQLLERNPVISLGSGEWARLGGATGKATITANTLRTLGTGIVEQDIVSRYEHNSAVGDKRSGYLEVICRFKQTGPDSRFVQVAKVGYAANGTMIRRVLLEGIVTRDWQPTADKISKQVNRPWQRIVLIHDI
jgi:hypothetical protein